MLGWHLMSGYVRILTPMKLDQRSIRIGRPSQPVDEARSNRVVTFVTISELAWSVAEVKLIQHFPCSK